MGPVIAPVGHRVRRPSGARTGDRRVQALIAVDRRVGDGAERRRVGQHAAKEMIGHRRQAQLAGRVVEQVLVAVRRPHRQMHVAAIAGQMGERLGHEGRSQAMLFGDGADHELEKGVAVGGHQGVGIFPVHLELAIGVLVVVLIRPPAQRTHGVANLGDDVIAAHQGLLVVAGLGGGVIGVGQGRAIGREQHVFGLDPGFQAIAGGLGPRQQVFQHHPGGLRHRRAFDHQIAGHPGNLGTPRQLHHARRVRHAEHVRVGRGHIEISREPGETGAGALHLVNGRGRHQFGALHARQVGEID